MAMIKFDDFAERYCGTNDRAEQLEILKDNMLTESLDEVSKEDITELFGTECQIEQDYFEPNDYYDVTINGKYTCMSLISIIQNL